MSVRDHAYWTARSTAEGKGLQYGTPEIRNEKEVVLGIVKQRPRELQYASDNLKNDKEVVLAAVHQYGEALQYASVSLRNDKEVVLEAVKSMGEALQFAPAFKDNKEIVLAAVSTSGWALQYASERLKNDKEVVLAAMSKSPVALQYAGDEFKRTLISGFKAPKGSGNISKKVNQNTDVSNLAELTEQGSLAETEKLTDEQDSRIPSEDKLNDLNELYSQLKAKNDEIEELIGKVAEELSRREKLLKQYAELREKSCAIYKKFQIVDDDKQLELERAYQKGEVKPTGETLVVPHADSNLVYPEEQSRSR